MISPIFKPEKTLAEDIKFSVYETKKPLLNNRRRKYKIAYNEKFIIG